MAQPSYKPGLHRIALLTAAATFPLIFMGGLVTSHGAGMAVPDWPNSYGYNMFLFPPSLWLGTDKGGVFYEHAHRLMGSLVGMLSIALCVWAWAAEPRRWVRWLATAVLGAVILQGVLGGLRVVLVELDLAVIHGCFAQAFFCLAAVTAVVTSRWWHDAPDLSTDEASPAGRRLIAAALVAVLAIYLQLVVGAMMRHYGAGLAIPDLPLAYGQLLPPVSGAGLQAVNDHRVWQLGMEKVSLGQLWLHFAHRVGAIVVSLLVVGVVLHVLVKNRKQPKLLRPAWFVLGLLATQVTLGVLTVLMKKPADVATMHVACGALLLMTTFVLAVRAMRLYSPALRGIRAGREDRRSGEMEWKLATA